MANARSPRRTEVPESANARQLLLTTKSHLIRFHYCYLLSLDITAMGKIRCRQPAAGQPVTCPNPWADAAVPLQTETPKYSVLIRQ